MSSTNNSSNNNDSEPAGVSEPTGSASAPPPAPADDKPAADAAVESAADGASAADDGAKPAADDVPKPAVDVAVEPAADDGAKPLPARPRRGAIGGRPPKPRQAGPGVPEIAEPADQAPDLPEPRQAGLGEPDAAEPVDKESAPLEPRKAGPGVNEAAKPADKAQDVSEPRKAGPGVLEVTVESGDKAPEVSEAVKGGPGGSEMSESVDQESAPSEPRKAGPGVPDSAEVVDKAAGVFEPRKAGPGVPDSAEPTDKASATPEPRQAGPAVAAAKSAAGVKAEPEEPSAKAGPGPAEAAEDAAAGAGSSDPTQVIGPPRTSIKPVSAPPAPPEPSAALTPRQSIAAILAGSPEPGPPPPPTDDAASTKVLPAASAQASAGQTPPATATAATAAAASAADRAKPETQSATASSAASTPSAVPGSGAKASPASSAPAPSAGSASGVRTSPASSASTPPTKPSPTAIEPEAEGQTIESKPRRAVRIILPLLVLVALVGAYGVLSAYLGQRVPAETTVGGVAIGSLPIDEAVTKLEAELGTRLNGPIPVTVGTAQAELDPGAAGIVFDARETVKGITGLSFNPSTLWTAIRGLGPVEPVMRVDQAALGDQLDRLAAQVAVEPVDGTISVSTGTVETTEPVVGLELDVEQAAALKPVVWLTEQRPLALPFTEPEPDVTDEVLADAKSRLADPLLSGPVIVEVGGKRIEVPVDVLAKAATLRWTDGRMALDLDRAAITASVKAREPEGLETEPVNAEFGWEDGHPVIRDGQVGTTLDVESIVAAVVEAATKTDDRTADVALIEIKPTRDRTALEELGIKEVVADPICTYAPPSWARDGNLDKAAGILTGIVVMPGETFSLDEALGHRSAETGWFNAGVMVGGVHKDDIGGGLSQISTTIYNMAFWAGFELVEHTTHSEWFSRYPMGREATLWEGFIDNKFRNNTPYAAMLHVWHSGTDMCGEVWSTKYYRINAWTGEPYNYVSPTTIHKPEGPDCSPQSAGNAGFDVVDHRQIFLLETDELVSDESISTHYSPYNAYVCDPPASPDPPPGGGG